MLAHPRNDDGIVGCHASLHSLAMTMEEYGGLPRMLSHPRNDEGESVFTSNHKRLSILVHNDKNVLLNRA